MVTQLGEGGTPFSDARGVAIQADGKVVAVGFATDNAGQDAALVTRMNSDGAADPSFGSGGRVLIQFDPSENRGSEAPAVAIQSDGKIVIAGDTGVSGGNDDVLVARLNPNGSFDSSFGSGGAVIVPVGTGTQAAGQAVAIDPSGRIVVAGYAEDTSNAQQLMVLRLNPDGSPDLAFGSGGMVVQQLGMGTGAQSEARAVALQPDGKIVLVGDGTGTGATGGDSVLLARLNADGSFDGSFGSGGDVLIQLGAGAHPNSAASAVALQPDGQIVIAGNATGSGGDGQLLVARLSPAGGLDPAFGSGGEVTAQLKTGGNNGSVAAGVQLQPNGRILLAGGAGFGGDFSQLVVARLNSNGSFDTTFGTAGKVVTQVGSGPSPGSDGSAIALQPDGKVVVAGDASDSSGARSVLVARLVGDLPPSATFTNSPHIGIPGRPISFNAAASVDADGTVTGYHWSFGDGSAGSGVSPTHTYEHAGRYTVTLTVTDDDALTGSSSQTVMVSVPPVLSHVAESARKWLEGRKLARITTTARLPVGTTFRFTLNEAARVTFSFTQPGQGRRVGKRCLRHTKHNGHKRHCTLTTTLSFSGHSGVNRVHFDGRLARHKKLAPGRYTLIITATNTAGQHAQRTLTFTIIS